MSDDRLDELLRVDISESAGSRRRPVADAVPERRRRSTLVIVALWCAGLVLVVVGVGIVSNSTSGRLVDIVDDPTAPGFEALVEGTPTMALLSVDGDDLVGIAVLTLGRPDEGGGGIVVVPQRTIDDLAVFGRSPLDVAFALGDERSLVDALGVLVGFAVPERAVVDDERWAELVAPVAPIVVDNPNVLSTDGEEVFEVGVVELEPSDVGPFLRARAEGEGDLERLYRHELFFAAWLEAIAGHGGVDAVPGELDGGVGHFMRTLAGGATEVVTLPVEEDDSEEFGPAPAYETRPEAQDLLDRLVPFPRSPEPGARPRVRILNGTVDTEQAARVAPSLPPVGIEIVSIGNAPRLDRRTTSVRYTLPEFADEADDIADVLGIDDVARDETVSDSYDITVTLGADVPPES